MAIGTVLAILVLAVIALSLGAMAVWRRGLRKQAVLMGVLAVLAAINVAIWVVPDADGRAPVNEGLR